MLIYSYMEFYYWCFKDIASLKGVNSLQRIPMTVSGPASRRNLARQGQHQLDLVYVEPNPFTKCPKRIEANKAFAFYAAAFADIHASNSSTIDIQIRI